MRIDSGKARPGSLAAKGFFAGLSSDESPPACLPSDHQLCAPPRDQDRRADRRTYVGRHDRSLCDSVSNRRLYAVGEATDGRGRSKWARLRPGSLVGGFPRIFVVASDSRIRVATSSPDDCRRPGGLLENACRVQRLTRGIALARATANWLPTRAVGCSPRPVRADGRSARHDFAGDRSGGTSAGSMIGPRRSGGGALRRALFAPAPARGPDTQLLEALRFFVEVATGNSLGPPPQSPRGLSLVELVSSFHVGLVAGPGVRGPSAVLGAWKNTPFRAFRPRIARG